MADARQTPTNIDHERRIRLLEDTVTRIERLLEEHGAELARWVPVVERDELARELRTALLTRSVKALGAFAALTTAFGGIATGAHALGWL